MNTDKPSNERASPPYLSRREVDVLQCLGSGMANKEMARHLGISCRTVERHLYLIMCKLDIHDRVNLLRYAVATGLVSIAPIIKDNE